MDNRYKFVDGDCKTIQEFTHPYKVIPEENQIVTVKNKEYSVYRVDETINFDNFTRSIIVYLNNL